MTTIENRRPPVVDYDSNQYDYRDYWTDRGYEQRAEHLTLQRVLRRMPLAGWSADLGGGYGRNVEHLLRFSENVVLVDYSRTNLRNAARRWAAQIADGRVHLIRADLHALPLRDRAVDTALAVRVLHHLPDLDVCLPEMMRTVRARALLDVPIKNHVLARVRQWHGGVDVSGPGPLQQGDTEFPFSAFALPEVRTSLSAAGFDSHVAASVNNFRRWDRVVPAGGVKALAPFVDGLEAVAQRAGRGWWGPNQFLLCTRADAPHRFAPGLAGRVQCPGCRGDLDWTAATAHCSWCETDYRHTDGYWDFTVGS